MQMMSRPVTPPSCSVVCQRKGDSWPEQVPLPGFSSLLIGQQRTPSDTGHFPLGNCLCFMLCWTEVTVWKMGYHSCHVVILDPVTLPQQTGRMEEGCQDVCGYVWVDEFRYLYVSFCLCIQLVCLYFLLVLFSNVMHDQQIDLIYSVSINFLKNPPGI